MRKRLFEAVGLYVCYRLARECPVSRNGETYLLHLADSVVNFGRVDVRTALEAFQISTLRDRGFAG